MRHKFSQVSTSFHKFPQVSTSFHKFPQVSTSFRKFRRRTFFLHVQATAVQVPAVSFLNVHHRLSLPLVEAAQVFLGFSFVGLLPLLPLFPLLLGQQQGFLTLLFVFLFSPSCLFRLVLFLLHFAAKYIHLSCLFAWKMEGGRWKEEDGRRKMEPGRWNKEQRTKNKEEEMT